MRQIWTTRLVLFVGALLLIASVLFGLVRT
jgi:hypothetical protein